MSKSVQEIFEQFPVEKAFRSKLPFHLLKSRLSSTIVFSMLARKKDATIIAIVLCKSSRAYIITQSGLKGFLLTEHDNGASYAYEL